ncbi:MAG: hypothetical protein ACE1Z8_04145 [Candidatus Acidiferrales bacterium]
MINLKLLAAEPRWQGLFGYASLDCVPFDYAQGKRDKPSGSAWEWQTRMSALLNQLAIDVNKVAGRRVSGIR